MPGAGGGLVVMNDSPASTSPQPLGPAATGEVPSDHSLLVRLRGGQQDAATQLYVRYAQRLRALVRARCSSQLVRRLEPDDIVQSVFRRFFRHVLQGDYDVPPGEELWGLLLVSWMDNIVRPLVISNATRMPFLLVVFGVLGGVLAFGLVGLFIGPVLLAVSLAIWREWLEEHQQDVPDAAASDVVRERRSA